MPDSTETSAAGAEARGQRAATAAARDQAWREYITHPQTCDDCRTNGINCGLAADLRQIWRDAVKAAS